MTCRMTKILVAAAFASLISTVVLAEQPVSALYFELAAGDAPGLVVSASGEGCCDFSAELAGTFSLYYDPQTDEAWIGDADITMASAVTWRLGVPVTDPDSWMFALAAEWLDGRPMSEVVPGILSDIPGEAATDTTFTFGPHFSDDSIGFSYRWKYDVIVDGEGSRLVGESVFYGCDGASFFVNVPIVQVVPEPSTGLLASSGVLLAVAILRRRRRWPN